MLTTPDPSDSVLLIHGTGAARPSREGDAWWQTGSLPQRDFDALLDGFARCDADVFHWSGANSELARRQAADLLYARLRAFEASRRPYHLVGHSHGGSVIWLALRRAVRERTTLAHLRSWTTIGTPFLHYSPNAFNGWLLVPLAMTLAAFSPWPSPFADVGTDTPGRAFREYLHHALEAWHLGGPLPIVTIAFMWTLLLLLGFGLLARVGAVVSAHVRSVRERRVKDETYGLYGPRHFAVWARTDEAINGLGSSLHLGGDIVPKWRSAAASTLRRVAAFVTAPIRAAYNAIFARSMDELIWERVTEHLQGNDTRTWDLAVVSSQPSAAVRGWPPLPEAIEAELVRGADANAASTIAAMRETLALTTMSPAGAPTVVPMLASRMTLLELVHTTYYLHAGVRRQIARHITQSATGNTERHDKRHGDWYEDARAAVMEQAGTARPSSAATERHALRFLAAAVTTVMIVLLWIASSALYRTTVVPLTDDAQVATALNEGARLTRYVNQDEIGPWLLARAMRGEVDAARREASTAQLMNAWPSQRIHIWATLAGALRAVGDSANASAIERVATDSVLKLPSEPNRDWAANRLNAELASAGIVDSRLLTPVFLRYEHDKGVEAVMTNLANGPHIASALERYRREPHAGNAPPLIGALMRAHRVADAGAIAAAIVDSVSPFEHSVVLRALFATQQDSLAERMRRAAASSDYSRDQFQAALARVLAEWGRIDRAVLLIDSVRTWQYAEADAAGFARALRSAGHSSEAGRVSRAAIRAAVAEDNPWWNAKLLISNREGLRAAGTEALYDSTLHAVLERSTLQYADDVLLRAVFEFISIGALNEAVEYVGMFKQPTDRAYALSLVAIAAADRGSSSRARELVAASRRLIDSVTDDSRRSRGHRTLACALGHLGDFREARMEAQLASSSADRLAAYAEIIVRYAMRHEATLESSVRAYVADPPVYAPCGIEELTTAGDRG